MTTLNQLEFQLTNATPFKNEAAFTSWFGSKITKDGGFFHKISDYSLGFKPFDAVFGYKGLVGCIEFKFTRQASCLPYTMLRGSCPNNPGTQVKSLTDYATNGGNSIVIVYSAKKNTYKILDFTTISLSTKIVF